YASSCDKVCFFLGRSWVRSASQKEQIFLFSCLTLQYVHCIVTHPIFLFLFNSKIIFICFSFFFFFKHFFFGYVVCYFFFYYLLFFSYIIFFFIFFSFFFDFKHFFFGYVDCKFFFN